MDLHLHTKHSDGTMTVQEIFQLAYDKKIKYIAITDHDTIKGVREGEKLANKYNLHLVPGVEINTEFNKKEVHVLGYFIDIDNPSLTQALDNLRNGRLSRVTKIVEKLKSLEIDITLDDVLLESKGDSVGRPHVARALIKKGYGKTVAEIFDKYLDINKPAYVERFKLSPFDAINLIKESGGIAVLAHPRLVFDEKLVDEMLPYFDGVEVYHSEHSTEDFLIYKEKAIKNNLIITGGSDCHGKGKGQDQDILLGTVKIPEEFKVRIKEIYKERYGNSQ